MYKTFPPFIDAYHQHNESISKMGKKHDEIFKLFKDSLMNSASEWDKQTIGEQVLRLGEPAKLNGKFILAVGWFATGSIRNGNSKCKMYALISSGDAFAKDVEIIEHTYPREFDVT